MNHLLWIAVLTGLACAPASAHAQFFGRGGIYRSVYTGGYNGYSGGYGSYNANYGGGYNANYGGGYHPIFGYMSPTYTTANIPLGNFGPGPVTHPYAIGGNTVGNGYGYNVIPGDPAPRMRSSLYPAIPVRDTPLGIVNPVPELVAPELLPTPAIQDPTRASIQIQVPQLNAKLFFDDVATKEPGLIRVFNTPPLEKGFDYSFRVRVTWEDALGERQEKAWTIRVRAGDALRDSFKDH